MRILITGGGTGGHIYPALAIAQRILKKYPEAELLYLGSQKGLEAKIVPETDIPFRAINVEGLPRNLSLKSFKSFLKALDGLGKALKIIKEFAPTVVLGTGGYVCGPVVLAARILKIPTIIHEQNALPGLTNRLLARIVDRILITFPESKKYFKNDRKIIFTGLPIREEITATSSLEGYTYLGLESRKKTLLITGGSRGAQRLNQAMLEIYPELIQRKDLQIIHLTGHFGYQDILEGLLAQGINIEEYGNIMLKPYLEHMEYALAIADFYIARAGATFIAEVTAKGIPGLLIPYPYAAENHQQFNAQSLVDQDAALMVLDRDLNGKRLLELTFGILENPNRLEAMGKQSKKAGNMDSLAKIIIVIEDLAKKK